MSLAIVHSRAQVGIDAPPVAVEVHLANGLPSLSIVGMPETAVRESKDRVRSALLNSRYEFPARRITVNLAPADLPKEGGRFDLPIAIGILLASNQLQAAAVDDHEFVGELALSGDLRPVRAVLTATIAAALDRRAVVLARGNAEEAALAVGACVLPAAHLLEVAAHLSGQRILSRFSATPGADLTPVPDIRDVKGQAFAKRALEVAAAGGHSLLMIGPPGTGKTMLATRLPGLLPELDEREALATAAIASLTGAGFNARAWRRRPFRAPHHSASSVALVGGGSHPRPGEISLAHNGVLFLDELPEFERRALEQLREPLESGVVNLSRAAQQVQYPARFQFIAAMNPCRCGWLGDARCRCTEEQVRKYRARVSGPLLDRIDVQVEVPVVSKEVLYGGPQAESSAAVRDRVSAAREHQHNRSGCLNARLAGVEMEQVCDLDPAARALLDKAMDRLGLSARAYHRILRVARTVADLAQEQAISDTHIGEAVRYRVLDRTS